MNVHWQKTSESTLFDNKYVHVVRKKFMLSDGEKRDYSIIKGRDNVQVIALTEEGKVITISQFRTGPEIVLLDIPGGGIDEYESIKKAAARELFEETGYIGKKTTEIAKNYNGPTREGFTAIVIIEGCYKKSLPRNEEKQLQNISLVNLQEFRQKLIKGNMIISVVAAGLTALNYLNDGEKTKQ